MNKNLMTVVVESLAFCELAGDDAIDPDAAASQLEGATSTLSELTQEEKAEFIEFIQEYADEEEQQKGPPERIEFFRALPQILGLSGRG
jgi:hypothetical protein